MNIGSKLLRPFKKDLNLSYLTHTINKESKINVNVNLQKNILNFYNKNTISPYVPMAAKGPWILTHKDEIIYDVGGYGMLGYGHSPEWLLDTMAKDHVMANVMTPSIEQFKISNMLKEKIGNPCPYYKFGFLNSGSEAMELAGRIIDTNAKKSNKRSKFIVLKDSFHGRTSNAALFSHSGSELYKNKLKSYGYHNMTETVEINNENQFQVKVLNALLDGYNIDAVIMEPVQGEGNPGIHLSREFYRCVREITNKLNIPLVIDSVQAGIRTNGCLSVVDYPQMEGLDAPDMEIFSKAISSGHYPLSVLAMKEHIADMYEIGTYGNTMCANPKALDIGYETLSRLTPNVSANIIVQGHNFKNMLLELQDKFPNIITNVTGTGLLLAAHIREDIPVVGYNKMETKCRLNGLNVIHGGKNALRFTPWFLISDDEIDLIKNILTKVLSEY